MIEIGVPEDLITRFGYAGLFAISFLAATVLPMSSEILVAVMTAFGYDVSLVVALATAGNYLGSVVNYYVGAQGARFLLARYLGARADALAKARRTYGRWGSPLLLFSWVPVIGDPLTIVAGALRVNFLVFTFWVALGKLARYVAIATVAH
jgi:membrane protein YqaA with SNARE-associated domain